ncbi:MAG: LppX_LprAFG lipoprotein [Aggregatilineales bacterium]
MRYLPLVCMLLALAAGCSAAPATETPPDPTTLVAQAAANIRASDRFRMTVERTGAPYEVDTGLGRVTFRRASAQYVAPDTLQATVSLTAAGLTAEVDIFARGENQWFRNVILTGGTWLNAPFAEGFNPQVLIAEETGFEAALAAVRELTYAGPAALEDGTPVHHISGVAEGHDISALLAGLIEASGLTQVEVYIHRETGLPARFVIVQPETASEQFPTPTTWTVDIYDYGAPARLDDPEARQS